MSRGWGRVFVAIAVGAAGCAIGCQHDVSTAFPPGLAPLDGNPPSPPRAAPGDPYPETIELVQGSDDTSDFARATGYVKASLPDVWSAFKDPQVVVDRHNVDHWTSTPNVEPSYDVSFRTHYEVDKAVTVTFDITWREGVVAGTEADPTGVSVVYEKTYGSSFISLMKGSIELTQVTPTVTMLQFSQRMSASQTSSIDIAKWTLGLFTSVVARVHGNPLP